MQARLGCGFAILNIFEDARIESHGRKISFLGRPVRLNWKRWGNLMSEDSTLGTKPISPANVIINATMSGGSNKEKKAVRAKLGSEVDEIYTYYRRACLCADTFALEPVIRDFLARFGTPTVSGGGYHATSAMDAASGASGGGHAAGAAAGSPESEAGGGSDGDSSFVPEVIGGHVHDKHMDMSSALARATMGDKETFETAEKQSRSLIQPRMREVMKVGESKQFTVSPKGRISLRHVSSGLPTIYADKKKKGDNRKMKVRAIIDVSGSMQSSYAYRGLGALNHALAEMNEKGEIELDCWLSGDGKYSHIPDMKAAHTRGVVCCSGDENISRTLNISNKFKPHADYDALLIITDGQITDASVKKDDFHAYPNTIACYIPESWPMDAHMLKRMREQFPLAICRPDVSSLTTAVCQHIASLRARRKGGK